MSTSSLSRIERISRISTIWTRIRDLQSAIPDQKLEALNEFFERYSLAAHSYLVKLLSSEELADEAFQEFSLKLLSGGFRGASPQKGKFRSYLKTALIHFSIDLRRKVKGRNVDMNELEDNHPSNDVSDNELEQEFLKTWREEILEKTWDALKNLETPKAPWYSLLRMKTEDIDLSSEEMTQRLNRLDLSADKTFSNDQVRKILQRAREKFANLLIDEVAKSLESDGKSEIEQELLALGLFEYCRATFLNRFAS